jgi:DNA-binding transcriptional MerR regulator
MLTIGNVAKRVGVRPSAIRFYETKGIVRPAARRQNGYRIYGNDAIKLLLFVRRAQSLGITLREIKSLLDLATQGQRPCNHVKQLARSHLQEIDQKISALRTLRNELRTLLRRKAGRPHGDEVCPIIERRRASISQKLPPITHHHSAH